MANRTSLVPHANRTRGQQDKPCATDQQVEQRKPRVQSETTGQARHYEGVKDAGVVSTSGQQGKPGTTE